MTPDDYIAQRVDAQVAWYRNKGGRAQRKFKAFRVVEIVSAALIPLVAGFLTTIPFGSLVVAVLGVVVAVCAAMVGFGHYQEVWINYRTTSELLKQQKYLFLTGSAPYDTDEPFPLLVQSVEALISKENSQWAQQARTPAKSTPAVRGGSE